MAPVRLPAFILKTRGPLPCTGAFKFLPHYFPGSTPSHSAVNPLPASAIFLSLLCVSCAQEAAGLRLAYVLASAPSCDPAPAIRALSLPPRCIKSS